MSTVLEELAQPHHANAILCAYARHAGVTDLARRYDVSVGLVERVLDGRRYGAVTGHWHPRPEDRTEIHMAALSSRV